MTWFRTDDDFPEHVKVDALEAAAAGVAQGIDRLFEDLTEGRL